MMDLLATLENSAFAAWLRESNSIWAFPTILTLHTVGLGILVGANWALAFRILGVGREIPLASLMQLFRAMWIGFVINAITGCMLFVTDATTKGTTTIFMIKLALIFAAVVTLLTTKRVVDRSAAGTGLVPVTAKVLAGCSLVLWAGAITAGRLMAYL